MTDRIPDGGPYPEGSPEFKESMRWLADASSNRVDTKSADWNDGYETGFAEGASGKFNPDGSYAIPNSAAECRCGDGAYPAPHFEGCPADTKVAGATPNRVVKARTYWGQAYLEGWRAAMTEAKGGDWSQEVPDGW